MASEAREFRESVAIEQKINTDVQARKAWLNQQLVFEASVVAEEALEGEESVSLLPIVSADAQVVLA
jgi:hypothetical protein